MEYPHNEKYPDEERDLARFAKALGHPARIAIVKYLSTIQCCFFGEIHNELPIAQATVSQHLKELQSAGLIQGSIEPPKVKYCINQENWERARVLFGDLFSPPAPSFHPGNGEIKQKCI
ncbi:MAG TPA: helix-turn-helix domain-containing protein [Bacteroidales bacterium]|nr:helix-turn-helix domain-containing protein [Bacteroidales bacterium]